ncbi:MAG: VOC family protein [Devosiaceae bacterium]|nr:VOC family protein [Devosiaceae bacterium]
MLKLDHFAFACADLDEGVTALSDILGAEPVVRAKHELFGTHNALWRLETDGDPVYLELIAIDPKAPEPKRKRWFGLDDPEVQSRFQSGFQLLTFVVNTDDFESARQQFLVDPGKPVEVCRNDLVWQFSLHEDGALVDEGALPYLIEWAPGPRPVQGMDQQNIRVLGVGGRRISNLDMGFDCPVFPSQANLELFLMSADAKQVRFASE